ncbi:MAG: mechanosensitive ion channel family protein [Clostridia bacterium]|nr:mechanosensitive ion channel family protein [Clostridia bacterium]
MADTVSNPSDAAENLWDALQKWQSSTFELGFAGTIVYTLIVAAITALGLWIVKKTLSQRLTGSLRFFYRLIRTLIYVLAVFSILVTITPLKDLGSALLASSGIASVIVGLAAQESLGNLFSGMSIILGKPFVVGEYIELMSSSPVVSGTVTAITLRHTVISDANNKSIVIPNSTMDQGVVKRSPQHTASGSAPSVNNFLDVGVSYDSDIDKAMQIMAELVAKQPEYVDQRTKEQIAKGDPEVTVRVQELASSSVNLRAWVWTRTVSDGFKALSDLRLAVKKAFDANGIEIPYPYQNVILKRDGDDDAAAQTATVKKAPSSAPNKNAGNGTK